MKFLIFSDIHGAEDSAAFIKETYSRVKPDKILLLGDILYHGPRNDLPEHYNPKAVISILNDIADEIIAVRGNCEAEVDQMVLNFSCLSDSAIVYADNNTLFLTHGHIYNRENRPKGSVTHILSGHTHIPVAEKCDGIVFFNPGSITMPKGGSKRSYGIYADGVLEAIEKESGKTFLRI